MFYASVTDISGRKRGILAGPYRTHGAALAASLLCASAARRTSPTQAAFAAFGTCRVKTKAMRERIGKPKLNDLIGYVPDALP